MRITLCGGSLLDRPISSNLQNPHIGRRNYAMSNGNTVIRPIDQLISLLRVLVIEKIYRVCVGRKDVDNWTDCQFPQSSTSTYPRPIASQNIGRTLDGGALRQAVSP